MHGLPTNGLRSLRCYGKRLFKALCGQKSAPITERSRETLSRLEERFQREGGRVSPAYVTGQTIGRSPWAPRGVFR